MKKLILSLTLCLPLILLAQSTSFDPAQSFMADFSFQKADGTNFKFEEVAGKLVLLDFWATWCGPCIRQHPSLEKLRKKINDPKFVVITVSIDRDFAAWQQFLSDKDWKDINIYLGFNQGHPLFQVVAQTIETANGKQISAVSVPQYYLLDQKGKLAKIEEELDSKLLEEKITILLGQ